MSYDLSGQTAIVTGGASGIGRSIVERLGEEGASIVIGDIQEDNAEETANELRSKDISVEVVGCDVTSPEDANRLASETKNRFGSVDILVNNAGKSSKGSFEHLSLNDWNDKIDLNLTGVFNCSKAVVPSMIDQDRGVIVNISSMAGRGISYSGSAAYTASKWGVIGLTKHMAWDLADHGIRVNAVCPGGTRTPMVDRKFDEMGLEERRRKIPLGRWAEPRDQANAVMYLVSDESSYLTGAVLEVDGGTQLGIRTEI